MERKRERERERECVYVGVHTSLVVYLQHPTVYRLYSINSS